MRAFIETLKTIRARHRAARREGLGAYTVILLWCTEEYAHYAPELIQVRAASPLAAELDAMLQAATHNAHRVQQFGGLTGRALLLEAGNQMKVIATIKGSHTAVSSDHF
ncbi:hypothetical protein ABT224_36175 [Streptomyces sp. NPDC001584]|uniref:hypothetical protein n=1 Tax=Streptomyces sp. NPDC001584 TaxID=3154521 RepID=UPI003325927C